MENPRGSPIALPLPDLVSHSDKRRRPSNLTTQSRPVFGTTSSRMAIPGSRPNDVPPPLPPPRYNHDLDEGVDIAWAWENEDSRHGRNRLAPIKPGSSLLGGQAPVQPVKDDDEDVLMELDDEDPRSGILPSNLATDALCYTTSLGRGPPGGSSPILRLNQRLHGDRPLALQNHHQSISAYDQRLLSRIGKSGSSPRALHGSPTGALASHTTLSVQTKISDITSRPTTHTSASLEAIPTWSASPTSVIAPSLRSIRRQRSMEFSSTDSDPMRKNQTDTSNLPPSFEGKTSGHVTHPNPHQKRNDPSLLPHRSSYDSAYFAEDTDFVEDDETYGTLLINERPRVKAIHGTKRRALSPPLEQVSDKSTELIPTRVPGHNNMVDLISQPQGRTGSLSSNASSTMPNSLASSHLLSNTSSMTNKSSLEPMKMVNNPNFSIAGGSLPALSPFTTTVASRRASDQPTFQTNVSPHPTLASGGAPLVIHQHLCSCCPKKPRKFETEEKLRLHESEKQYTCGYCNNRFKNKNEAERHQNSLHLRKQSWSCAAIASYQAAFHPSSIFNPRNLSSDTCGYCGEEFSNLPTDWETRIEHLTNVHKFGECNVTKKFFRADHFRQHLKHSHAGKSGKWTNILENNCIREETLSEPASLSPTASEHSQSGSSSRPQGSSLNPLDAA